MHASPTEHDCPGEPISNPYDVQYGKFTQTGNSVKIRSEQVQAGSEVFTEEQMNRTDTSGGYQWHRDEKYIPANAFDSDSGVEIRGVFWRDGGELYHFLIGGGMMYLMALLANYRILSQNPGFFQTGGVFLQAALFALLSTAAFIIHELSHRQTAKFYGFQTKFRLVTLGMGITLFSIIAGGGFAVPGAVMIIGLDEEDTRDQTGMCKAAGPGSNLIFGGILFLLALVLPDSLVIARFFLLQGVLFNFALGLFNLLPVAILDGANIIRWKKQVWIGMVALFIVGIVGYYFYMQYLGEIYRDIF